MKRTATAVLLVILTLLLVSCGQINWPDTELGDMVPKIKNAKGRVEYENADILKVLLEDIEEEDYKNYINNICRDAGFDIDAAEDNGTFVAFNRDGYKLSVVWSINKNMTIALEVPIKMSAFTWPNNEIGELLPVPESNRGSMIWASEDGFAVYVGDTTRREYSAYVNEALKRGFRTGAEKESYYIVTASGRYDLSIKYEGFNTMWIRLVKAETN